MAIFLASLWDVSPSIIIVADGPEVTRSSVESVSGPGKVMARGLLVGDMMFLFIGIGPAAVILLFGDMVSPLPGLGGEMGFLGLVGGDTGEDSLL